jgi:hypothetical protein
MQRILATVSPERKRYKEFEKNGGLKLFMPLFRLSELQEIGKHIRQQPSTSDTTKILLSNTSIDARYHEFGGIIRYVLPDNNRMLAFVRSDRNQAIKETSPKRLHNPITIEDNYISHLIMKYVVDYNESDLYEKFSSIHIDFVSDMVVELCREKWEMLETSELIFQLIKANEDLDMKQYPSLPIRYEIVVIRLLTAPGRYLWDVRPYANISTQPYRQELFQFTKAVGRDYPPYDDMVLNTLYYPNDSNFPVADAIVKTGSSELTCFQVSFAKSKTGLTRHINSSTVDKFLNLTGITGNKDVKLRFILVPNPKVPDAARVTVDANITSWFSSFEVLRIPVNFEMKIEAHSANVDGVSETMLSESDIPSKGKATPNHSKNKSAKPKKPRSKSKDDV